MAAFQPLAHHSLRFAGLTLALACLGLASAWQLAPTEAAMEKYVDCPAQGMTRATGETGKRYLENNRMKNRFRAPAKIDRSVTLAKLLQPGDDENRWSTTKDIPVQITGYVAFAIQNWEGEGCNCYKRDENHSDTHVDLVLSPADYNDLTKHVVVELTPRTKYLGRMAGKDWSTGGLIRQFMHKKVTVTGYLLYDFGHKLQARNTNPKDPKKRNWRATAWEVHPVTDIRLAE